MSLEIFHKIRMMKNLKNSPEGLNMKRLSAKFVLYILTGLKKRLFKCIPRVEKTRSK